MQGVGIAVLAVGLSRNVVESLGDLLVGIGHADDAQRAHVFRDILVIEIGLGHERVARHHRLRNDAARVDQVGGMPVVGVLAADPRQVRPGPFRSPLEGMIVHALGGEAVVAVPLRFVTERADHLAMTEVAPLADVDVAPRQFERRVGSHALDLLDRLLHRVEWHHLHQTADGHRDQDADGEQDSVLLEDCVFVHRCPLFTGAGGDDMGGLLELGLGPKLTLDRLPQVVDHDQRTQQEQHAAGGSDHVVGVHRLDRLDE